MAAPFCEAVGGPGYGRPVPPQPPATGISPGQRPAGPGRRPSNLECQTCEVQKRARDENGLQLPGRRWAKGEKGWQSGSAVGACMGGRRRGGVASGGGRREMGWHPVRLRQCDAVETTLVAGDLGSRCTHLARRATASSGLHRRLGGTARGARRRIDDDAASMDIAPCSGLMAADPLAVVILRGAQQPAGTREHSACQDSTSPAARRQQRRRSVTPNRNTGRECPYGKELGVPEAANTSTCRSRPLLAPAVRPAAFGRRRCQEAAKCDQPWTGERERTSFTEDREWSSPQVDATSTWGLPRSDLTPEIRG